MIECDGRVCRVRQYSIRLELLILEKQIRRVDLENLLVAIEDSEIAAWWILTSQELGKVVAIVGQREHQTLKHVRWRARDWYRQRD